MVLHRYRFYEVVNQDIKWSVFSVLFVLVYMWFHLRSLYLGVSGLLIILLSFPVTQIIYIGVFKVTMFSSLNQLVIFIILGIAADNIFVFCDAWRQSELIPVMKHNPHRRMAYSFKRAAKAIAVTSSTTSVAFAANAGSPLIPIKAFGIYASIIVIVNYAMVVLVMPPIQMIYETKIKEKEKCPCCVCLRKKDKKKENIELEDQVKTANDNEMVGQPAAFIDDVKTKSTKPSKADKKN